MPGVTKDQIKRAREIDVLDYVLSHESSDFRRVGKSYRMRKHPSMEVKAGKWRWYSQGLHGRTALDYLTDVRGYDLVKAVCMLLGEKPSDRSDRQTNKPLTQSITPSSKPTPERVPFSLPLRNKNNSRVIEYLQSRGIDKQLIFDCIKRGVLYENARYHNCVFVGRDENGKARFAALRGTTGDFKCDADGSDKRYGFALPPSATNSFKIAAFESAIDCLSHQTLCNQGFLAPFDGWRLALGGTSILALTHFLERHAEVRHCLICTDNDEAGNMIADKIAKLPRMTTARSPPVCGKDWNETLKSIGNEVNPMEDVRKDIRFIDSNYNTMFNIKDGDSIKITVGFDGEEVIRKCRHLDEAHLIVGSTTYHICEFAERMEKAGNKYEPAPKQERNIDILSAKYGEPLQAASIPMTEAAIKKLVGGKYEKTPLLYPSGKVAAALVSGKDGIAVCGIKDGTLTSLHPYNAQIYKRELSPAEPSAQAAKKPSLQNKLDSAKGKAAAQNAANSRGNNPKQHDSAELG